MKTCQREPCGPVRRENEQGAEIGRADDHNRKSELETADGTFQISLEEEKGQGYLVILRQGPAGQALVQALRPEQVVEMTPGIPEAGASEVPPELQRVLEEHKLEIRAEACGARQRASIGRHAEYKDSPSSQTLSTASATGLTRGEAVANPVRNLSGKLLALDAYGLNRREIQMPEFDREKELE